MNIEAHVSFQARDFMFFWIYAQDWVTLLIKEPPYCSLLWLHQFTLPPAMGAWAKYAFLTDLENFKCIMLLNNSNKNLKHF